MNVGILTFHASHNYGAMLQTYALKKSVNGLGHDASVINFYSQAVEGHNQKFKLNSNLRQLIKNGLFMLHAREWKRRYRRYEEFKESNFNLTQRFYSSQELRDNPPAFDAYITGSDQVWNAEQRFDPVWLLDFVREGRKIAYAPSFGASFVAEKSIPVFQRYLPAFDALSCRETQGVKMLKDMTGLQAEHVLDPTLLLTKSDWEKVGGDPYTQKPYLLVYCLEESPAFMQLVLLVAERTGLDVVVIGGSMVNRFRGVRRVVRDAGPAEYVGLFRNATMVCTNSFHGTAFSLLFEKPFFSVPHTTRNSRIASLLSIAGLGARQLSDPRTIQDWSEDDLSIDYSHVTPRIEDARQASLLYLAGALS